MKYEPTNRRVLLWTIIAALAAWGVLLAVGAYLGLDPQTPDHDLRRVGVALLAVGGFLGVWLLLLVTRRRPRR
jgi:membrane protein DedA with SNARE-associated domain